MENKICQSCGMPITSNEQLGKNKDGSINTDESLTKLGAVINE